MIGRPGGPPLVSFSFAEGRFFDLWMGVHFLSGVAGGFSNTFFGLSAPQVFALGFLMMLGWEIGEHAQRVRESLANRALDVVVGLAGTALALVLSRGLSPGWVRVAFALTLLAALGGAALGARARRRRTTAAERVA